MPRRSVSSKDLIPQYAWLLTALGAAVALRRRTKYLTQEQLAQQAGVKRGYISTLEAGRANPTLISLHRVAASLDWSLVDLFRAAGDPRPKPKD
jgi:transcriptional regulator with XRE-family HTH domain